MKKYKEAELFEALTDFHDSCIRQGHTNHEENAKYFMEENEEYDLDYYQIMGMLKDMDKEMTIKESRAKAGLTQQKMSDKLGIPKRTIEDWERGRRTPPAWAEKLVKKELERMNKYTEQKENLEKQNWHIYKSEGGKSFFTSKDISGIIVEVDQVTGETTINKGCPDDYFQKNKPVV